MTTVAASTSAIARSPDPSQVKGMNLNATWHERLRPIDRPAHECSHASTQRGSQHCYAWAAHPVSIGIQDNRWPITRSVAWGNTRDLVVAKPLEVALKGLAEWHHDLGVIALADRTIRASLPAVRFDVAKCAPNRSHVKTCSTTIDLPIDDN